MKHKRLNEVGLILRQIAAKGRMDKELFASLNDVSPGFVASLAASIPETQDTSQGLFGAKLGDRIRNLKDMVDERKVTANMVFQNL